ncbi:inactive protein RESTRICTED TEV MOVEMENT 1-like [Lycium barbarum]|uniref:inactive protein RESTRICTED TEV MOVEMENT 1-like n=1 Tax=Lycium barbarum TaxID=112863 RepID=UPI00293F5174|nr:inactive protein RESTRICTED TEV MOVEMENT 1-like [Lycium barbarum]
MDMVKVGPAKAQGYCGNFWDEKGRGELAQLFVACDGIGVSSLQFLFYENSTLVLSDKHGSDDCNKFNAIVLDYPSEFLTSISGQFVSGQFVNGQSGLMTRFSYLKTISFYTNKGSYGPFGSTATDGSDFFNFEIGNYRSFCGFHGTAHGYGIGSIGVYMKPITTSMIHFRNPLVKVESEEDQEEV